MTIPEGTVVSDPATGRSSTFRKTCRDSHCCWGRSGSPISASGGSISISFRKDWRPGSLHEAKKGLLFAGYLKLLIPLIVVIPGITAYVLFTNPHLILGLQDSITTADSAYPWLLKNFTPTGIKGLAFAALVAAIVSSLASMINSTATIFTMDIYKRLIAPAASEKRLVNIGRMVAFCALFIAMGRRQAAARRTGSGIPVHSGVFGICLSGSYRSLQHGTVMEKSHEPGRFMDLYPYDSGRHRP